MYPLPYIKAANEAAVKEAAARRKQAEVMERRALKPLDPGAEESLTRQIGDSSRRINDWLADAEQKLRGRVVVRIDNEDPLFGALAEVEEVALAMSGDEVAVFVRAPVKAVSDDLAHERTMTGEQRANLRSRLVASIALLEIGEDCILLALDDTPSKA